MGRNRLHLKLLYFLFLTAILSGCGREEGSHQLGIDGYVYAAQQVDLQEMLTENFRTGADGYLYCRLGDYSSGTELRRFPIEELFSPEAPELPAGESLFTADCQPGYIQDYTVDEEGCVYYLEERRDVRDVPILRPLDGMDGYTVDDAERSYVLVKRLSDGTEEYCVSLPGAGRSLALGESGNVCVRTEDYIYIVSKNGRMLDRIALEEDRGRLLEGAGGKVYYDLEDSRNEIFELAGDGTSGSFRLKGLEGPDPRGGSFAGSRQGLMCSGSDGMLYRYRGEQASWETLLCWGDSNLSVRWNWELIPLSGDRMMVCIPAPGQSGAQRKEAWLLTRTPVEELPEKEILIMASCNLYEQLEQYVMEFNRSSEQYHITIRHTDEAGLDADLVSSDPPDLINLTDLDYSKYGRKDVLEDLGPYLEESSLLGREDFPDAILEACTVKGRLVCIPDEISCTTVMGRASQVGTAAGWTAADAMALADANPGASLFLHNTFSAMVQEFFRDYILEEYVDWEKGECSFESEGFLDFIKWVAEHSDGTDSGEIPMEVLMGTMPEERLLSIWTQILSLEELLYQRAYFGEEVTAVGYPTADGSASHHGKAINHLGIVAASGRKAGAWHFMESFLARENGDYTFLPARKDIRDELAETLLAEDAGDMASNERKIRIWIPDCIDEYYAGMTRDELDAVYAVLDTADYMPREAGDEIIDIIVEEMSPCMTGAKSYEEAAAIVQNRVSLLVQEGM